MRESDISVQALQDLLNKNKTVFILDVRPQEQREEWHIPGSIHIDAYDMNLPENIPIVTVCGAGKTSQIAADILKEKGYQAYSLEGGMKAWNYAWNTAKLLSGDPDIKIIQVRRAAKGCLSYVIGSGNEAVVVDAALDPELYLAIARNHGWKIRYVMDTHIHADYLSRTRELAAESGAEHVFIENAAVDYPFIPLNDGQKLSFEASQIKILHTPGHTPESTSYLINNKVLLTGDTLFTDGVGRPDLKADKEEAYRKAVQLYGSLQRIMELPEDTIILPAHISHAVPFDDKIIMERLYDLRKKLELLHLPKEQFVETTLKRIPPAPPNYLTIARLNKIGDFEGYQPAELEAGANRCAVV